MCAHEKDADLAVLYAGAVFGETTHSELLQDAVKAQGAW